MNEILSQIITMVGIAIGTGLAALISALFAKLQEKIKSQTLKECLETIEQQAILVVTELNQTVVDDLKNSKDGWNDELKARVTEDAMQIMKRNVPDAILYTLEKHGTDIESAIVSAIQAAVNKLKKEQ